MEHKIIKDTNPFVRITVSNQKGEILFYSSDPLEIGKQNLNGLGNKCYIDIDGKRYIIDDLSISVFSSPMDFKYGSDLIQEKFRGREIPYLCDIKIKTTL